MLYESLRIIMLCVFATFLPIIFLMICVAQLIFYGLIFVGSFLGVYHAFSASIVLGVLSIFGCGTITPIIEVVDWFSHKELWVEIATLLGV